MEPKDVFEEWDGYSKGKKLRGRDLDLERMVRNSERNIAAVSGIRRAGKSSVLMLIRQKLENEGKKSAYINLEDNRIKYLENVLDQVIKWFGDEGFLLLDEITCIDGWDGWLARTHEPLKGKLRLLVSSSRRGLAEPEKPLRGRILLYGMYPLSFREYLSFKDIKAEKTTAGRGKLENALSEYLKFGGFPEVVFAGDEIDKAMLLNAYFDDILGLDVAEMAKEDVSIVKTFGRYALQSTYFSASKCLNFFKSMGQKIGKEKILSLEHCSEESYLFFFVPIFSYNIKDRTQYPRKAYAGDTGFAYGLLGKMEFGRIYENMVFLELRRRTQGMVQIRYWKNKHGLEVDFVIKQGMNIQGLIQVCYDISEEKTRSREIDSVVACAKEFDKDEAIIITRDESGETQVDGVKITLIPLLEWLQQ